MATFVFAPEVTVHIRTAESSRGKGKIIDVSEDVASGQVNRVLNGISSARISLLNQSRKYDGMFTPMDTITIRLRRIRTMLKFSGYLDSVPLWAAAQGSVNLTASCSLKRLQNYHWDPTSPAGMQLLNHNDPNRNLMNDGGMAQRAINVMTEVARWPKGQIHIARVPETWYDRVGAIADQLIAESESLQMMVSSGAGSWVGGENPLTAGRDTIEGIGAGTGTLPARSGRISHFGGPGGGAYGNMALTGESGVRPRDDWYAAMRWPYTDQGAVRGAKEWWKNRRILVVNPKSNKAVVLRAADWGPHVSTGRVIDVSPRAMSLLGAGTDDTVHISFAPENANLGPVSKADAGLGSILSGGSGGGAGSFQSGGAPAPSSGWGQAGDERNIVRARAGGKTFYVHRLAKANFEGFVNDLVNDLGYRPQVIGGYNDRNIAGTSRKSNHAWGLAIDIDPERNPYVQGTAPFALPKQGLVKLARKWGLGWGGEWRNAKDYMHFEVIGGPSSTTYDGVEGGGGAGATVVAKWKPPIHGKYTVTARFGEKGGSWANGHSGTDFAASTGTNIYPVGPGTVFSKGTDSSYGNYLSIDHGSKVYTFYAHMNGPSPVSVGEPVSTSTVIGHVGSTGNVTGPHLHLELRKGADTYSAALKSGGIEKYVLGGANRSDPPAGTQGVEATVTGEGTDLSPEQIGRGLFNVWQYNLASATQEGILLGGYRAVMNDTPVLNTVGDFMRATLRDFCSAPNGDFIGWFPDYFGHYGVAGKMVLTPMEIDLQDGPPTIGWDDTNLKTHQFVSGATTYMANDAASIFHRATTAGIASVEFPELMMALLGVNRREAERMRDHFLFRYGARPNYTPMNNISGARQEFFFACHLFMQNWSQQYQTRLALNFLPEAYPGMLLCLPMYGIQGYIRETTDTWDMTSGFRTNVSCAPWSTIGATSKVPDSLPRGAPL